ncbi:hypothetical protein R1sor_025942 [Riccia sorocarpa]|uniref:Uncharacterized protein n=1 Tax=Riccia sorocarpa TaxID=122646 RepID=A0ABD3GFN6_9MARC
MMRRRQVAYAIVAILILGCQSIGNFASRPLLEQRGPLAEKLAETASDDAAGSTRKFQRYLSEQFTNQMTPVVRESKNIEEAPHEHQHDHGRILSQQPPKQPPARVPPTYQDLRPQPPTSNR